MVIEAPVLNRVSETGNKGLGAFQRLPHATKTVLECFLKNCRIAPNGIHALLAQDTVTDDPFAQKRLTSLAAFSGPSPRAFQTAVFQSSGGVSNEESLCKEDFWSFP
jgi:hypothetical protein